MVNLLKGLFLSFQFFTSLPIRKQFSMNHQTVTAMYMTLPIISLLMGGTTALLLFLNEEYLHFSTFLLAVIIVVANIVMTGGLHLDGWIDMSDAYFSYQDRERRLEILSDSRVGAFGAISLVVMILLKVTFIHEVLRNDIYVVMIYFIIIPLLSRLALLIYFLTMKNVKDTGLAAYFKSQVLSKKVWVSIALSFLLIIFITYYFKNVQVFGLFFFMVLFVLLYRKWTKKNFGGMTGDLVGALYEGTETFLWGILILLLFI